MNQCNFSIGVRKRCDGRFDRRQVAFHRWNPPHKGHLNCSSVLGNPRRPVMHCILRDLAGNNLFTFSSPVVVASLDEAESNAILLRMQEALKRNMTHWITEGTPSVLSIGLKEVLMLHGVLQKWQRKFTIWQGVCQYLLHIKSANAEVESFGLCSAG